MKTGLLRKGFLSVALAVALLVSLVPLTALAANPLPPSSEGGEPQYTFELTGYEYGKQVSGVKAMRGDANKADGVFESENVYSAAHTTDKYFAANKQYYLAVRCSLDADQIGSPLNNDVALKCGSSTLLATGVTLTDDRQAFIAAFELPMLEAAYFAIPFTKVVEQGGDVAPGEGSFELNVLAYGDEIESLGEGFTIKDGGSFSTEGAGSTVKYLNIKNDSYDAIEKLLQDGILVSEESSAVDGWSCDSTVWLVRFKQSPVVNSMSDNQQDASATIAQPLEFLKGYMEGGEFVPDSQISVDEMSFTNVFTAFDPVTSLTLSFVKKVTQGGTMAPGKETFKLEVFDVGNSGVDEYADVTCAAAVNTDGAGEFDGELTVAGPTSQVESFVSEGFFVREVKGDAEGWTYSDAVWFVAYESDESSYVVHPNLDNASNNGDPAGVVEPQSVLVAYHTTCEVGDQGEKIYSKTGDPVAKMSFENVYTADAPAVLAKTGDSVNAGLLVTLLLVSACVVAGAAYGARKKLVK